MPQGTHPSSFSPFVAAFLALCLWAQPCAATVFYVRADAGDDAHDGLTPATAFASITTAAAQLSNPGDQVIVGPGTYVEGDISPARGGVQGRPINFLADPTGTLTGGFPGPVVIMPPWDQATGFRLLGQQFVVIDGFHIIGPVDAGIQVRASPNRTANSSHITIRNTLVRGSLKRGLDIAGTGQITIERVTVTDNNSSGIAADGCLSPSERCAPRHGAPATVTIANSTVGSNGAHGVFVAGTDAALLQDNIVFSNFFTAITLRSAPNTTLLNNLLYANGGDAIAVGTDNSAAPEASIVSNTIYMNWGFGLRIDGTPSASSSGARVLNNIFDSNRLAGITVAAPATCGYVAGFNVNPDGYGEKTPRSPYDISTKPVFAAPAGADGILGGDHFADDNFRLQEEYPVRVGFRYSASADEHVEVSAPFMPVFVRADGDDGLDGRSPGSALRSITTAAHRAAAGVTIVVGPGEYREGNITPKSHSGVLTFLADPLGQFTGDNPDAVLVDASGAARGFKLMKSCSAAVDGFNVRNARLAGIQIGPDAHGTTVRNNIVFSNEGRGIEVLNSDDVIINNNLVYGNGTGGIQLGGAYGSHRALVTNNTSYANGAVGILIGTGGGASTSASVKYNIVHANTDNGIQLTPESTPGYTSGYNINTDGYGAAAVRAASDLLLDPLFVAPAGTDGLIGGTGFRDDDFHLAQIKAGQSVDSPAVDFGPVSARSLDLAERTTRTDGVPDTGQIDLGHHYLVRPADAIYVSTEGSDENSGRVSSRPLRTIHEALRRVRLSGTPQEVRLAGGVYLEADLRPPAGVHIMSDPKNLAVIDAQGGHTVFDVRAAGICLITIGVTGAGDAGIRVRGDDFRLLGARVFSNHNKGIFLASGNRPLIFNNIIYGNENSGIVIGSNRTPVDDAIVAQNTIYQNANRGVTVGLGTAVPSPRTIIAHNILSGNNRAGIEVGGDSAASTRVFWNCNNDGYAGIRPPRSDVRADPSLSKPAGADKVLGGAGAGDDSFRLTHPQTNGDAASPCIDISMVRASHVGLRRTSTRLDGQWDGGRLDLGFHYGQMNLHRIIVADAVRRWLPKLARYAEERAAGSRLRSRRRLRRSARGTRTRGKAGTLRTEGSSDAY